MKPVEEAPAEGGDGAQPAEGQEPQMQEVEVKHEKNTDEKAVIILKVPQVEEEEEITIEVNEESGDKKTQIVKKLVDEDQKEHAIAIIGRDVAGVRIVEAK